MKNGFQEKIDAIIKQVIPEYRSKALSDVNLVFETGADSYESWLTILKEQKANPERLRTICWAVARCGDETAIPALLVALKARDPLLRAEAALALGTLGDSQSLPYLLESLTKDEDIQVRTVSAHALGMLNHQKAVKPLIEVLLEIKERPKVRGQAAESLSDIGDERAVEPLIASLGDSSVEVRFWSAFALGKLGDIRALPVLKKLSVTDCEILQGWGTVSEEARESIKAIENFRY
ncbi:MAG: HEAT repeat domain-containing protein [Cyanobacteriota bacterium]|nr:HEAT repeat domain-containing protein [Cyanobacteriota bacterium]